jgi:hypothetical protein
MKKIVFRNGSYTVLRPLYYLCKIFGLAPYSYVADRRNKGVTPDYGYLNYMFTVIWLIVLSVGLPLEILGAERFHKISHILYIVYVLYNISSYTSSIVTVFWVSVIERRMFMYINENISEVDNKIQYTPQEETYMNRKLKFNIISEIILLAVVQSIVIVYYVYQIKSDGYYIFMLTLISINSTYICNTLFSFQYLNLIFIVKQRYSHLKKRISNWINGTVSRQIHLTKVKERCNRSYRTNDLINISPLFDTNVVNVEGTLKQTDIRSLRQIYCELYDITCLINDSYGVPILAYICWILTVVVCCLFGLLINFTAWGVPDVIYAITCSALIFKITLFCHSATKEASSIRILVHKLLLEGNCSIECVEELKMFSLQLQVMTIEYTACGFFSINLKLFTTVVSVIASYFIILVQIK